MWRTSSQEVLMVGVREPKQSGQQTLPWFSKAVSYSAEDCRPTGPVLEEWKNRWTWLW